jgi:hypothetical protein
MREHFVLDLWRSLDRTGQCAGKNQGGWQPAYSEFHVGYSLKYG